MLHKSAKTFLRWKRIWNMFQMCLKPIFSMSWDVSNLSGAKHLKKLNCMQHNLSHATQECKVFLTIETNMKHVSNVLKNFLFNSLRCFEPFWSITSQITQLHAAYLIKMQYTLSNCQDFLFDLQKHIFIF